MNEKTSNTLDKAKSMVKSYADAMLATQELLDEAFVRAVDAVASLDATLIISGLGKSGLVGKKSAATFSSTGTRAVFIHPVDGLHGDLGVVDSHSGLLAISKSGSNEETIEFARQFKNVAKGAVITLTEPDSKLERLADIALHIPQLPEIDEWNLAPTISTVTSSTILDVLAICVQDQKGFTAEDFAQFHPRGALGKRLLLDVKDFMIEQADLPIRNADSKFSELIYAISSGGLGLVLLVDEEGSFMGVLTDGDIRRLMERGEPITSMDARSCLTASRRGGDLPQVQKGWTTPETKAIDCLRQMQEDQITSIVILESKRPVGLVRMQDLVAAGIG